MNERVYLTRLLCTVYNHAYIRLGGFNIFSSISRLFLRWSRPKSIATLDEGMAEFVPLDPPLHAQMHVWNRNLYVA